MSFSVHVIIVTHNSADVLHTCLKFLENQTCPANNIVLVDSGSNSREYLEPARKTKGVKVIEVDNIGYSCANNIGYNALEDKDGLIIFMNPDTFLPSEYIACALKRIKENSNAGIVSGKLLGYDQLKGVATGSLDSTGIYRKWYGRWYDRGQGETDHGQYDQECVAPAVCGALMCCNGKALQTLEEVFDSDFFLYKEDIELSLRLRKMGWSLLYDPRLTAYHCRGWNSRKNMPRSLRIIAAESEVLLYKKHPSPYILWAFLKLMAVKLAGM